ncbi:protein phosphatase 1 regulatory subunit 14D isoform X1 [Phyllostomus discolor]|uniref:Protein phosphatase 1 regulatory subunit 14 n=1 Tax=Phyllostomus discolor TaxID=89673 RepID=A0A7E6E8W3_9CHIR|nr:protein phosphatase 1 regulatory subunit 14D isoform X1 [Phyllostomus discolor]
MLSSSPASCTSPNPDKESPSKKVQWASGRSRTSSTDSKSHPDPSKASRSRRSNRLTVKYDRGQLQSWLEMEQWVDTKVQELFQDQPTPSEPDIDLEALMELSTEEQRTQLEVLLRDCRCPTEVRVPYCPGVRGYPVGGSYGREARPHIFSPPLALGR